jgi:hypothetical protein
MVWTSTRPIAHATYAHHFGHVHSLNMQRPLEIIFYRRTWLRDKGIYICFFHYVFILYAGATDIIVKICDVGLESGLTLIVQ